MADIKLSYFDARGRAELSRLILAYAGVGLYLFLQISRIWPTMSLSLVM